MRSGAARSCSGPPILPSVNSARIDPGVGKRLAIDDTGRIPQLRADDRLGALEVGALNRDHEHAFRHLAVHGEAFRQLRIGRNDGAAVDPHGFADAGNEKQQRDARVAHEVAQRIDAIVAATVGDDEGVCVEHPDKTRRVAARRAVEPLGPACGHHAERSRLDQLAVLRRDLIGFLENRRAVGRIRIELFKFRGGRDRVVMPIAVHRRSPFRHEFTHAASNCLPSCAAIFTSTSCPGFLVAPA